MRRLHASCDGSAGVSARVHDVFPIMILCVVEQRLDAWLREGPCTRIKGFLLGPDDGFCVGVHVEVLLEPHPGERIELLDASDCHVFEGVVGAVLVQSHIDLARAEYYAVDLVGGGDCSSFMGGVGKDPAEAGLTNEVFDVGPGQGVAQEGLGEEENESWMNTVGVSWDAYQHVDGIRNVRFRNCRFI